MEGKFSKNLINDLRACFAPPIRSFLISCGEIAYVGQTRPDVQIAAAFGFHGKCSHALRGASALETPSALSRLHQNAELNIRRHRVYKLIMFKKQTNKQQQQQTTGFDPREQTDPVL